MCYGVPNIYLYIQTFMCIYYIHNVEVMPGGSTSQISTGWCMEDSKLVID